MSSTKAENQFQIHLSESICPFVWNWWNRTKIAEARL